MKMEITKMLEEAKAAHHAKLHEHQEAEAALLQFQQHVSNLAVQALQLDARVKAFQEVSDGEKALESQGQAEGTEAGPQGGAGGPAEGSPS